MRSSALWALAALIGVSVSVHARLTTTSDYSFELPRPAEVALKVRASAPGTSWEKPGAEAAVLRIDVDGAYNQHLTLFLGAERHQYAVLLGPLAAGPHRVHAELDRSWSPPAVRSFEADFSMQTWEPGSPEYAATRYAPILYARPDTIGHFTDAPLLAWYEWLPPSSDAPVGAERMLKFSYVFSNEDAGTNTPALMARWGRTTDIEHVYRVFFDKAGAEISAIFQGVEHKETQFHGQRLGAHLLTGVASRNNNFSDEAVSRVRIALLPELLDLSSHSREEVMDRHPWSYRVMAQEMEREGKLAEIGDLRGYLYLEARVQVVAAGASFGVTLADGRSFRSDGEHAGRRVERSGWVRSTIALPPGTSLNALRSLTFFCGSPEKPPKRPQQPACSVDAVSKLFFLGRDYLPGPALEPGLLPARTLAIGQSATFDLPALRSQGLRAQNRE